MILGVDHIALSCEDVVVASRQLEKAGYHVMFIHQDAPNRPAKRRFLQEYNPLHSVAYCQPKTGPALELTQHSCPLEDTRSPYQVLLPRALPGSIPIEFSEPACLSVWEAALGCRQPKLGLSPALHAQFWHDETWAGSSSAGPTAVLLPVADAARSEHFWRSGLGFHSVSAGIANGGRRWVHLTFSSPLPNWSLDVILAEGCGDAPPPLMDMAGFPCLGLLSTSLALDSERVRSAGASESSGEFQLEINGRPLKLTVIQGPNQELIELVEIGRGNY